MKQKLKLPIVDHVAQKYVCQKKQRDYGYFDDNRCCILRWTNEGSKLFATVAQLNDWIADHPEEYATCTYVYVYERSKEFLTYLPPQLQLLDVRFSKIRHHDLPEMPSTLRSLIFIKCCQLHAFDIIACANRCPELEEIVLYACGLTQICLFPERPDDVLQGMIRHAHLRIVDLSYNQLTHVNISREIPTSVSLLYIDNNMLTSIVRASRNTHPDMEVTLHGNTMSIQGENHVFRQRGALQDTGDPSIIYNKAQNVHSRSVQETANNSVQIIWQLYQAKLQGLSCAERKAWEEEGWKEDVITFLNDIVLTNMIEHADDATVHSIHAITMKEIIKRVWTIIAFESDREKKNEMAAVFGDELKHGAGFCFTGRFTRVVNSMCGFVDGITIEISPQERVQGQLSALYNQLGKKDNCALNEEHETWLRELFGILYDAEMLEDFEKSAWPWIEPFVDFFIKNEEYAQHNYIKTLAHTYFEARKHQEQEENSRKNCIIA